MLISDEIIKKWCDVSRKLLKKKRGKEEEKKKMHTLANKISARERETAPKYYYKVFVLSSNHYNLFTTSGRYLFVQIFT